MEQKEGQVGRKKAPRQQKPPRRPPAKVELALPPTGPHGAHVPSPARASNIWAAIDPRAPDIRPMIRPRIGSVIRSHIRPAIWPSIWSDTGPGIRPHVRPVIWPRVRSAIWPTVRSAIGSYIRSSVGPNVGSPGHLLRRFVLRFGIDLCLQRGGTEDQEGSQSENIYAKHLKLLNDSVCLGRPPRSATKTIHIAKASLGEWGSGVAGATRRFVGGC